MTQEPGVWVRYEHTSELRIEVQRLEAVGGLNSLDDGAQLDVRVTARKPML